MPSVLKPDMELLEMWSAQLGVPFDKVLKQAGVSDPDDARASRARMRRGGAPRVREQLVSVLSELEKKRATRTEIGSLVLGIDEWTDLGAELATLDGSAFLRLLESLRERVVQARDVAKSEDAFKTIK